MVQEVSDRLLYREADHRESIELTTHRSFLIGLSSVSREAIHDGRSSCLMAQKAGNV
jgi:hypothetical protein